jgi:hypothetical protein
VPEQDQFTQIRNLQELVRRQSADINQLRKRAGGTEPRAAFRAWGVLLLGGLLASTMGTWLVLPHFTPAVNEDFPDSFMNFGLWDLFGSPGETVGGQTGIVMTLLFVLLGLGMAALVNPGAARLYCLAVSAVLLLAAEIWLRVGISGEVAGQAVGDGESYKYYYTYGGGGLSIALMLTVGIAAWAFTQAKNFKD